MKVKEIYRLIDQLAPFDQALDFDNPGMLVSDPEQEIDRVLLCLDITKQVLARAKRTDTKLIVSHHPLIFHPLKRIQCGDYVADMVRALIESDISIICAHTNFDVASPGVNDALAARLGLKNVSVLDPDGCKNAAGTATGLGRMGEIESCTPEQLAERVKNALAISHVRMAAGRSPIAKVAVAGGACGDMYRLAALHGCDAFITAEIKHDQYLSAAHQGLTMIDAGHYASEYYGLPILKERIEQAGIDCELAPFAPFPLTI